MGLLKAADAELLLLDDEEEEGLLDYEGDDDGAEYELSGPVIIGGEGMLAVEPIDMEEDLEGVVFFVGAETEVVFGEPVLVGGKASYMPEQEDAYDYTDTVIEHDFATDDYVPEDYGAETDYDPTLDPDYDPDAPPPALSAFQNLADTSEDAAAAAEEWATQQKTSMMTRLDSKVRDMMRDQARNFKDLTKEQISFVSAEEKTRLVSEALETIRSAPQTPNSTSSGSSRTSPTTSKTSPGITPKSCMRTSTKSARRCSRASKNTSRTRSTSSASR